jgi:hypothetical protein
MPEPKTKPTDVSVDAHLAAIASDDQLRDAQALVALMHRVTKAAATMWGPSIVGFGSYHYKYASGHEGDAPLVGFAVRKNEFAIYIVNGFEHQDALLATLGKHKAAQACVYVKRLADIDSKTLEKLIKASVAEIKKRYPAAK